MCGIKQKKFKNYFQVNSYFLKILPPQLAGIAQPPPIELQSPIVLQLLLMGTLLQLLLIGIAQPLVMGTAQPPLKKSKKDLAKT